MEQRVAGENGLVVAVLCEPADAVLRVARRVQALHRNAAELEAFAVRRRSGGRLAVLTTNDGQIFVAECRSLFFLSASVKLIVLLKTSALVTLGGTDQLLVATGVIPVTAGQKSAC